MFDSRVGRSRGLFDSRVGGSLGRTWEGQPDGRRIWNGQPGKIPFESPWGKGKSPLQPGRQNPLRNPLCKSPSNRLRSRVGRNRGRQGALGIGREFGVGREFGREVVSTSERGGWTRRIRAQNSEWEFGRPGRQDPLGNPLRSWVGSRVGSRVVRIPSGKVPLPGRQNPLRNPLAG